MFLHIHEDSTIKSSIEQPNNDDIDSINAGVLTVIRFNKDSGKFESLETNGDWQEL